MLALDGPIRPAQFDPEAAAQEQQLVVPPESSSLVLDADRERFLLEYVLVRLEDVAREMGRNPDGSVQSGSWMGVREENQMSYDKDFAWRSGIAVFGKTGGFTLGDNNRYARLLSARVRDDLLGTLPFFGAMTPRNGDAELTRAAEEYLQDQIGLSNVPAALREAIRVALVRNEAVVKTTYFVDRTTFVGPAEGVFVDERGLPVLTPSKGLYVYENDDAVPDPTTEGLYRLKKDPSFTFTADQYDTANLPRLEQPLIHYEGVKSNVIDYRDFLCPLDVETTDEADINAHLYDMPIASLRGRYGALEASRGYFSRHLPQSGLRQPRTAQGEQRKSDSGTSDTILVAETYMRVDLFPGKPPVELMVVIDKTNGELIWYDYLGNHLSRRPFAAIPGVERVLLRWYGVGVFSKMRHSGLYVDAQLNRINDKDSRESSLTIRHPNAVREWKAGAKTVFGTNEVLNYETSWQPGVAPIDRINLQENAELGMEMMREMRQAADLEFAVISGSSASANGLNQSDTATGVMSVERDANVVSKDMEQDIARGLENVLSQACEIELEHMPRTVMKLDKAGALLTLNREEIRSLDRRVRLLMTRTRSAEMLATNGQAEAVALRYWALDPERKRYLRPFYLKQLRGLEISDGDEYLGPAVTDQDVVAWKQQQAAAAGAQEQKPVSESIAIRLSDLTESERAQALAKAQIQAAPSAELASKMENEVILARMKHPDRPQAPKSKPATNGHRRS